MQFWEKDLMKDQISKLMENEDLMAEQAKLAATIHRNYYNALTSAGFSPSHALYLVGEHGVMMGFNPDSPED